MRCQNANENRETEALELAWHQVCKKMEVIESDDDNRIRCW